MLSLYGKTYAKNERQAVASLFDAAGTVNGFYKVTRAGVYLSDLQGKERAFIRKDGLGPVAVFMFEGRRHYMHSHATADEAWLGIPASYSAACDGARALARAAFQA